MPRILLSKNAGYLLLPPFFLARWQWGRAPLRRQIAQGWTRGPTRATCQQVLWQGTLCSARRLSPCSANSQWSYAICGISLITLCQNLTREMFKSTVQVGQPVWSGREWGHHHGSDGGIPSTGRGTIPAGRALPAPSMALGTSQTLLRQGSLHFPMQICYECIFNVKL